MKYLLVSMMCLLSSCTYNVSMAHTSGVADDVIDDNASNTPNIAPTVTVPLTPGSAIGITK
jgi:hypothetical protein